MAQVSEDSLVSPAEIKQEASETSGLYDAFLSGLSNDETSRLRWLANKRFPESESQGIDPVDYYYIDKDGDMAYRDPQTGKYKKEFQEYDIFGFGMDAEDVGGTVFPTLQFLSEVIGGAGGLIAGGTTAGVPGAIAGGVSGTAALGGAMYGMRAGISEMLDGPEMETAKLINDLSWSSAAGGIPFGAPAKGFPAFAQGVVKRFPGADGRKQLQNIIHEGGNDADEIIRFTQDKYDITLTRPEAQMMATKGTQLQYYLSKQPTSQKLWDFYHDRNLQVQDIADEFFGEIGSGKYVREGVRDKLTGKTSLDASLDVAEASDAVLKKLSQKRQERASLIYKDSFDMPDVSIDVSDLVKGLDDKLADKNTKGKLRKSLQDVRNSLIDQNTGQLKNTTEGLHNSLSQDFRPLIEGLTKDNQQFIKREVSQIRSQVSGRLKEANPLYKLATDVYDPTKGHLQVLEKSIVNAFAKASERGGAQATRLADRMFKGTASPKEITDLKRLLQAEFVDADGVTRSGAQDWQNLKGAWLQTQFDDAIASQVNPLGVSNKFLQSIGIRGQIGDVLPQAGTRDIGSDASTRAVDEAVTRGKRAKTWEAIMEPDELNNFVDLVEMMQAMSFISTRSASPTESLQTLSRIIESEGAGVLSKSKQLALGAINLVPRLLTKGLDDVTGKVMSVQKESYEELLIEAMINPKKAVELRQFLDTINPTMYLGLQTFIRGGEEGLDNLLTSIDERNAAIKSEQEGFSSEQLQKEFDQQQSDQQNLQTQIQDFEMPDIATPAFEPDLDPMQMASATILPDEKDREIAMRQQLGGIGSLG
tara:strand:+ start:7380 stop:9827 length:2448 start_codon:yes stop_codon:yes gene_type:complete